MKKLVASSQQLVVRVLFVFLILTTCYLLLTTSSALADDDCPDDLYYPDSDQNACIHKHGGFLDEGTDECVYNFEKTEESFCADYEVSFSPTPTPTPTSSAALSTDQTKSENAVENLNVNLPEEITDQVQVKESNFLKELLDSLLNLLGFQPRYPETFSERAKLQQESSSPEQLKPTGDITNQLKGSLGKDTGIYSTYLPKEINSEAKDVEDVQNNYEDAFVPKGVNPISD